MKIFLIFVGIIATAIGVATLLVHHGEELDASSKAYIENNIPPIVSTWSKSELVKRSAPQLEAIINQNADKIDGLFSTYAKLGGFERLHNVEGEAHFTYSTSGNNTTTAQYTAQGIFENSEATITIRLTKPADDWQIFYFGVDSPVFVEAQ